MHTHAHTLKRDENEGLSSLWPEFAATATATMMTTSTTTTAHLSNQTIKSEAVFVCIHSTSDSISLLKSFAELTQTTLTLPMNREIEIISDETTTPTSSTP